MSENMVERLARAMQRKSPVEAERERIRDDTFELVEAMSHTLMGTVHEDAWFRFVERLFAAIRSGEKG